MRSEDLSDAWLISYADMITLLMCFFAMFIALSAPKPEKLKKAQEMVKEEFMGETKYGEKKLRLDLKGLNSIVETYMLTNQVSLIETDKGVTIELSTLPLFDPGSATLKEEGKWMLEEVAKSLQAPMYKNFNIYIEGHTDDSPISTPLFPSNWELSTMRATNVLRFFLEKGMDKEKLHASGYADIYPKADNRDADGKAIAENQAKNRRVVIRVIKD